MEPQNPPTEGKVITLPSGATAEINPFKGKHVREANRLSDGDASLFIFAMIATTCTVNGKPIVIEDLEEMDGRDVLRLQGEFAVENFS